MAAIALLRCDASPYLGAGHLMRCLAFAETLTWAGWNCSFATNAEARATVPALGMRGFDVQENCEGNSVPVIDEATALVVVDHYGLDAGFERAVAGKGRTVIAFDDLADRAHSCAILVDPTPGRQDSDYAAQVPPSTRLLLGPRYAILRREWRAIRCSARRRLSTERPVERILVSMGATDPSDATGRVLTALQKAEIGAHIDIVLGAAAPALARITSRSAADVTVHVEPVDLPALAAAADLAIGAAGTSSFERAVLGLPAMMIPVAGNQRLVAQGFANAGAAEVLPPDVLDDPEALGARISTLAADHSRRAAMSHAAASFTDGRGAARLLVAAAGSISGVGGATIRLRLAETEDEDWLLTLQHQPATRRYALNPQIPDSATHARWFAGILDDDERLLMVIEADGVAVGMVRLDRKPEAQAIFDLSIAVDERRHGERIASGALALVRRMAPGADFIATVLPENQASLALFAASGFRADGGNRYRSCAA